MSFTLFLLPNTEKVFDDTMPRETAYEMADALAGETFSLQAAYRTDELFLPLSIAAVCESAAVTVSHVMGVPIPQQNEGARRAHGVYPDVLLPRSAAPVVVATGDDHLPFYEAGEQNLLSASPATGALWITLGQGKTPLSPGTHTLTVTATSLKTGKKLAAARFALRVLPVKTAEKTYFYSNWFHYDCLADYYDVPLWSRAYYTMLARYFEDAVRHGQTMILLPAITPPVDTAVGQERRSVQLVDITLQNGVYTFDFSRLGRFVRLCKKQGFIYFEHPHLFSQWGAAHAPNIYGKKEGQTVRLFGWETDADAGEYAAFLQAYIPAFLQKAREWGIEKGLFFHVSDEPNSRHEQSYRQAVETVRSLLAGYRRGDALSDIRYHQSGDVPFPIVALRAADDFYGKCEDFLLYHTGNPRWPGSRRLITVDNSEIRALGLHLFYYRAKGFLHWGYNYWYGSMSHGLFDPKLDPCGYKNMDGASFLVYPGQGGQPLGSVRAALMLAAFEDYRALTRLSQLRGYDFCLALCRDVLGQEPRATVFPDGDTLLALRAAVNRAIEAASL